MPVYEYQCKDGHITDLNTDWVTACHTESIPCAVCRKKAVRFAIPSRPPVVIGETCMKLENQVAIRDKASG